MLVLLVLTVVGALIAVLAVRSPHTHPFALIERCFPHERSDAP